MVQILLRAFSTTITVVIAVAVFATVGESSSGKVWAAVLSASVIALVEWLLIWAPKHFAVARKFLDARAKMIGSWLQNVDQVLRRQEDNRAVHVPQDTRFSIFWVDYSNSDGYGVHGFAYNAEGIENARWHSVGTPEFAPDGSSMTYRWEGNVMGVRAFDDDDPARTGIATINLREGETGKVEHVGIGLNFVVSYKRITYDVLNEIGFGQYRPDSLKDMAIRNRIAPAYAKSISGEKDLVG